MIQGYECRGHVTRRCTECTTKYKPHELVEFGPRASTGGRDSE